MRLPDRGLVMSTTSEQAVSESAMRRGDKSVNQVRKSACARRAN